ncbi:Poly(rC)-binding protein 1 [Triticum urartu]|uniref:Poly(RC)-binding protein 1 n=1 Tax=Triticum urartu TaxID=4572 RepID=M8A5W2_TRIUA|nr:Poly(rC)-binding protein 1 [Triticum urartu]
MGEVGDDATALQWCENMDGPAEAPAVTEHEMSEIPNPTSGEQADASIEEQANPESDVAEQIKEEAENTSDEEPKGTNNEESGNPSDEAQVTVKDDDMGDQNSEDQAIRSLEEPAEAEQLANVETEDTKWPGWPGESVFRVLVSAQKVGALIGRKGEFIKRMCDESKARIKILDGPPGVPERADRSTSKPYNYIVAIGLYSTLQLYSVLMCLLTFLFTGLSEVQKVSVYVVLMCYSLLVDAYSNWQRKALSKASSHIPFCIQNRRTVMVTRFSFVLICCKYDFKSFEYWMKIPVKKLHILAENDYLQSQNIQVHTRQQQVMISAKDEPDALIPPAIDGLLRVHNRITDGLDSETDQAQRGAGPAGPTRLLVPASQAGSLIGKQGATIKSIQDASKCALRILENVPPVALNDDRVVEIQGEPHDVHKAVELIANHLRKFLVDRSVLPLFEMQMKVHSAPREQPMPAPQQWGPPPPWSHPPNIPPSGPGYGGNPHFMPPRPQDNYYPPPDVHHVEKQPHYGISSYGRDANPTAAPTSGNQHLSHGSSQISQKMQVPLSYADAVIGSAGANISYIRKHSGATISIQEGVPGEMTVEIAGSASQVQTAQQLIKFFRLLLNLITILLLQNFMAEASPQVPPPGPAPPSQPVDSGYNSYPPYGGPSYATPPGGAGPTPHNGGGYGAHYPPNYGNLWALSYSILYLMVHHPYGKEKKRLLDCRHMCCEHPQIVFEFFEAFKFHFLKLISWEHKRCHHPKCPLALHYDIVHPGPIRNQSKKDDGVLNHGGLVVVRCMVGHICGLCTQEQKGALLERVHDSFHVRKHFAPYDMHIINECNVKFDVTRSRTVQQSIVARFIAWRQCGHCMRQP